jgi:hypothetical protein
VPLTRGQFFQSSLERKDLDIEMRYIPQVAASVAGEWQSGDYLEGLLCVWCL